MLLQNDLILLNMNLSIMRQTPWIIFKGTLKIVPTQRVLLIGTMPFVALQQLFKPALRNRLFSGLSGGTDGRVIKGGQKVCRNFFLALPFDSCFCCPSVTGREVLNEGWKGGRDAADFLDKHEYVCWSVALAP